MSDVKASVELRESLARPFRSLRSPNAYLSYPHVKNKHLIPTQIRNNLEFLWSRAIHTGRDVDVYLLKNVFVAAEGLVFDQKGRFFEVSRTYHEQESVVLAAESIQSGGLDVIRDRKLPRAILTKSRGASNYGHFVFEMLPRAVFARRELKVEGWPALIFDSPPAVAKAAKEALVCAGFKEEEIVAAGTDLIFVNELILVDGLTAHTQYISPFVMTYSDEVAAKIAPGRAKKIYATRATGGLRDFADEQAISNMLVNAGYTIIDCGSMSFTDQVAAFKGAESVVGVMGAALTNVIFCQPGTKLYCFCPAGASEVLFWMIAEGRRLNYREIRCEEIGPQLGSLPWNRTLNISPERVREEVEAV